MTTSAGILICCLSIAASPGDSWSGFRGTGDSVSLAESVPVDWSDETVAWRQSLKGYGQSSPIVFGDRVIVTSMAGDNKETAVISFFDLKDGDLLRVQEIPSSQHVKASGLVSRGAPTPCCDAERVYVLFESGDLAAMNHDGEFLWKRSLVREYGEIQGNHGISSSLAQNSGHIFVLMNHGGPSYLMACNKTNGETEWKTDYEKRVSWNSPVVTRSGDPSSDLIVVSGGGRVDAYDATNGDAVWYLVGVDGNTVPSATVAESRVWIGSSKVGQNFAIPLKAVGDRSSEMPVAICEKATCTFSSPLCHRGKVYCVSRAGVAFCNDATDGKLHWKKRIAGSCWASQVGVGDRVYFFSKDGTTTVVTAEKELAVVAENRLVIGEQTRVYGVAVVDHRILIRTGTELICIASKHK